MHAELKDKYTFREKCNANEIIEIGGGFVIVKALITKIFARADLTPSVAARGSTPINPQATWVQVRACVG